MWGERALARPAYKPRVKYNQPYTPQFQRNRVAVPISKPVKTKKRVKKKSNPLQKIILLLFAAFLVYLVFPYSYTNFVRPLILGPQNQSVKVDYQKFYNPTLNYLSNEMFLNQKFLSSPEVKKPQMQQLYEAEQMHVLTARLNNLMKSYPLIKPTIYVWDYSTGKYINIKGNTQYPAASIIKIPVLIELFRSIDMGQASLHDRMTLTEYYRSEGSGDLQFKSQGSHYSLDYLAKVMIQNSDNTATNMLMSLIGGKPDVNRAIRKWGIGKTYIENWLPDIKGQNLTTSKDIATMLYNIDNTSFLSLKSRESIIDYMSHVKNNRLLQAGLPPSALLIHKTGDIGSMLGDAGIVWTPSGKKYIVVILAKRPYNHPQGKDFIVAASSMIFNSIESGQY